MVMGPAGTGKSTYCKVMQEHCQNARRTVHVVNLDPAAEAFEYEVAFDIRGKGVTVRCRVFPSLSSVRRLCSLCPSRSSESEMARVFRGLVGYGNTPTLRTRCGLKISIRSARQL